MRHPIRSAAVIGASALLLAAGAGTASAQGSLQFALPFPISIPGLTSLAPGAAPAAVAPAAVAPAVALPAELGQMAFEGRVVAAVNEARIAVGADRLVTDPALAAAAGERAAQLALGDAAVGDLSVPEESGTSDRTVLALPAGATPQSTLTALLTDTGMRERMLDGEFTRIGVGVVTADDGTVHVVQEFGRG